MVDERVEVASEGGTYPVLVRNGLLDDLPALLQAYAPALRYAVISDRTVGGLYGEAVLASIMGAGGQATLHTFSPGEESKNRSTWGTLTDELLASGFGRDGVVLALGGGVTGDLAGFLAATYMRGVPVVQIPTSLVAMVDASVGGKTGVDVPAGKNLVGAFHPPRAVLADPAVLRTLPRAQRAMGLAEAVKHGAIRSLDHLAAIREGAGALLEGESAISGRLVAASVRIKAAVVAEDEREGGLRRILNFGHTLAHAIESVTRFQVSHGEAVSLGMVLEARLGEALGVTRAGTAHELTALLAELELPVARPEGCPSDPILAATRSDKKGTGGRARYVLLRELGIVDDAGGDWVHAVEDAAVRAVLLDW